MLYTAPASAATNDRRRILIADDHVVARQGIKFLLGDQSDLEICGEAEDGLQAVAKALELKPDLLILDIALPDGDGFGLVDWLRQQHEMKQLPLVVYSAQDLNEEERKKLQLGHTEFLTKARVQPQDVETLVLSMLRVPHGSSEVPLGWDGPSPSH